MFCKLASRPPCRPLYTNKRVSAADLRVERQRERERSMASRHGFDCAAPGSPNSQTRQRLIICFKCGDHEDAGGLETTHRLFSRPQILLPLRCWSRGGAWAVWGSRPKVDARGRSLCQMGSVADANGMARRYGCHCRTPGSPQRRNARNHVFAFSRHPGDMHIYSILLR